VDVDLGSQGQIKTEEKEDSDEMEVESDLGATAMQFSESMAVPPVPKTKGKTVAIPPSLNAPSLLVNTNIPLRLNRKRTKVE
jgi:hypothetical protein